MALQPPRQGMKPEDALIDCSQQSYLRITPPNMCQLMGQYDSCFFIRPPTPVAGKNDAHGFQPEGDGHTHALGFLDSYLRVCLGSDVEFAQFRRDALSPAEQAASQKKSQQQARSNQQRPSDVQNGYIEDPRRAKSWYVAFLRGSGCKDNRRRRWDCAKLIHHQLLLLHSAHCF